MTIEKRQREEDRRDLLERRQGGGEALCSCRPYAVRRGREQTRSRKPTHAHLHGWTSLQSGRSKRFGKKRGSIRRWSLMKVGQTDEGGGNAVCHWTLPREEGSVRSVSRVS